MRRVFLLLCLLCLVDRADASEECCCYCSCGDGLHNDCRCGPGSSCHPLCTCGRGDPLGSAKKNFGVNTDRIAKDEVYTVNGRLYQGPIGQPIPDDSGKLHLTIIGAETERQRVLTDLATAPDLAEFRDRFLVQDYPADHWAVTLCNSPRGKSFIAKTITTARSAWPRLCAGPPAAMTPSAIRTYAPLRLIGKAFPCPATCS
jgi:hypothetical protein